MDYILLVVGLVTLIGGGELLVRGSTQIALKANIPPLVIGLTVVAFGTSSPELFISINSVFDGSPDLAMGNVIGSNICNLGLVLGITALLSPIKVMRSSIRIDWPIAMFSSFALLFIIIDGDLHILEGICFLLLLSGYVFFRIKKARSSFLTESAVPIEGIEEGAKKNNLTKSILFFVMGCIGLYFGSDWLVQGAKNIAESFGVSQRIIGITLMAIGTSLPELVTSSVAAYRKETDLALGNLLGSNIFNILMILGVTSIITPIHISNDFRFSSAIYDFTLGAKDWTMELLRYDIVWMVIITLITLPFLINKRRVQRYEGGILLGVYFIYITYLFL